MAGEHNTVPWVVVIHRCLVEDIGRIVFNSEMSFSNVVSLASACLLWLLCIKYLKRATASSFSPTIMDRSPASGSFGLGGEKKESLVI